MASRRTIDNATNDPDFRKALKGWLAELDPKRVEVRQKAEAGARELIVSKGGSFDEDDVRQWCRLLNTDHRDGKDYVDRFSPGFTGALINAYVEALPALNQWMPKLFAIPDAALSAALDEFWQDKPIHNAGQSLPSAILYLRDPEKYAVWTPALAEGLAVFSGGDAMYEKTGESYLAYCADIGRLRKEHSIPLVGTDVVLIGAARYAKARDATGAEQLPTAALEAAGSMAKLQAATSIAVLDLEDWCDQILDRKQAVFFGPPGTGKTYLAQRLAAHLVGTEGRVETIQFHPSYSYEDFIEGLRPTTQVSGALGYEVRPGVFKRICDEARKKPDARFFLIIDEINRGNLAKIFGELLFALEYREQPITLAYSGTFSVPTNLYLLGTMNTSDRSIALVDHALRRRFRFIELDPKVEILEAFLQVQGVTDVSASLLTKLNQRLERERIDRGLLIGHSYFMREGMNATKLRQVVRYDLKPLLEEYFYTNPALARTVLEDVFPDAFEE